MTERLELDLGTITINEEGGTLSDLIVNRAVRVLLESYEVRRAVLARVEEVSDEVIRAAIQPIIAAAVTNAVQPTDLYGEPKGEPKTLREVIVERAQKYLTDQVGDYNRRRSRVEDFIAKEVDHAVKRELTEEMNAARSQVRAAVQEKGAEVIQETISRLARV
jgi:hypothetical protein